MVFNSLSYAIFLPIVFAVYWMINDKYRWVLIFLASYYFYMSWNNKYVLLILTTTVVSYFAAILLEKAKDKTVKKVILALSSIICLGILFVFKYFNFFSESFSALFNVFAIKLNPITLKLLLPVGISFYTFQTMSYAIDVYRGKISAEKHFGYYATFVSFFPQLVAGPIERTNNLLPQIKGEYKFDYSQATYGLKLMAWGYFKKIIIADNLAQYVSSVYDSPKSFSGFALVLATLFFTIQIYCDFSGYSDIAIGSAKLLGINLMKNFNSPYFSQSIKEFWGRWHISLSTWFRDYVYIPLGGNRVSKARHCFNLLITFLVSGLWHGANWTFVIWGGIHGMAQVIEDMLFRKDRLKSKGILAILRGILVFLFCAFAWIFFVSKSLPDAWYVVCNLFNGIWNISSYLLEGYVAIGMDTQTIMYTGLSIILLAVFDACSLNSDVINVISSKKKYVRWPIYVAFMMWIIINLPVKYVSEFIYFQF